MSRNDMLSLVQRILTGGDPLTTIARFELAPDELLHIANEQGVEGLLSARLQEAGMLPLARMEAFRRRQVQAELWFEQLRLGTLRALGCLYDANIPAIPLKGALLAERLYSVPSHRISGDIDILVKPADLPRACTALADLGYRIKGGEIPPLHKVAHNLLLVHSTQPPLELHFHAHDGFGATVFAASLFSHALETTVAGVQHLRLHPDDELAYLAIHAAGHRFVRLLWLVDLRQSLEHGASLRGARDVATSLGGRRAFDLAMLLLQERLGVKLDTSNVESDFGLVRRFLHATEARTLSPLADTASTFLVSLALCDRPSALGRYVLSKVTRDLPRRLWSMYSSRE